MQVKIDFNISAWIKELVIEADSEREALRQLNEMSLAEIVEAASIIDSTVDISDARTEVIEQDMVVQVTDVEYSFARNLDQAVIAYLNVRLPRELTLELRGVSAKEDIEERIKDEIELITDYTVESMNYQIIEEK